MTNRILKIGLFGNTNAGKSTLINSIVREKISIINKKINTTQESILGIINFDNTQLIFYDTPGTNFIKTSNLLQKKLKQNIWQSLDSVDMILFIIDSTKYKFNINYNQIKKISEIGKPIVVIFNKIDLLENKIIIPFINELNETNLIETFFNISAKHFKGVDRLIEFLKSKSLKKKWIYTNNEITNKDDIYIANECTRNEILTFLHQEIPYNIKIDNILFKYLKNEDLKIKQSIIIENPRYKSIILGKKGITIKKIREASQKEIQKILKCKVHLYLQVNIIND